MLIQGSHTLDEQKKCAVCKGTGTIELLNSQCPFCNGTGEYSKTAESYLKSHICQCIFLDRLNCPVCHKRCHHSSSQTPKQKIDPGYTGTSNTGYLSDKTTPLETIV